MLAGLREGKDLTGKHGVLTLLIKQLTEAAMQAELSHLAESEAPNRKNGSTPKTEIQHCIIHPIRNSLKSVASKNQKAFMADLKCVHQAQR